MHKQGLTVAVLGATGLVGQAVIEHLAKRAFSVSHLVPVASGRIAGQSVHWQEALRPVERFGDVDWQGVDLVFSCVESTVIEALMPTLRQAGCRVIDNSSHHRLDPSVPLVVPEVNGHHLSDHTLIANPNCSTIQLAVALAPLVQHVGVRHVDVVTFQSMSGAGRQAMETLRHQSQAWLEHDERFEDQRAFNVLPAIGDCDTEGHYEEENKLYFETQKIFGQVIPVNATAVRVPVMVGHGQAVHVTLNQSVALQTVIAWFKQSHGVRYVADDQITPVTHGVGHAHVVVGRVRLSRTGSCSLNFWSVSDNILKGAAVNAIQTAELMYETSEHS